VVTGAGEDIMHIKPIFFAAALALAACGQTTAPTAEPTAEAPTVDPHAMPVPSADPVTAEFLIGTWGDNGDCNSAVTFNADGTLRMQDGAPGTWTLEGDRLTMSGANGAFAVDITKGNDNQLFVGQPDGGFGISQRC
jgi:hypothetical protein